MALVNCPECEAQVSDRAGACPRCGFPAPFTATRHRPPTPSSSPYPCSMCDQAFASMPELHQHRATEHRGVVDFQHGATVAGGAEADESPGGWAQNKRLSCPHCRTRGEVAMRQVRAKRGISGGKATGAVLTGGLSLLATGLSRKETVTELHCNSCGVTWTV
jgi:hypothetical protein